MALRDQPYIPLYVQDFMTDEKLIECSASATGVYIRLMCLMHKSEEYGTILLKQKYKQSNKQSLNFASQLAKSFPYNLSEIESAIDELLSEKVLEIIEDYLVQRRMVKDNEISIKRSISGSKGGLKTQNNHKQPLKKLAKANNKANTENDYAIEGGIENFPISKSVVKIDFAKIKDLYNKTCVHNPSVKQITESRERAILARIKDSKPDDVYQFFESVFQTVANSNFLSGLSGNTWKASFDWILEKKNIIKIIEGNYDNTGTSRQNGNNTQWANGNAGTLPRPTGKQPHVFSGAEFSAKVQERLENQGLFD